MKVAGTALSNLIAALGAIATIMQWIGVEFDGVFGAAVSTAPIWTPIATAIAGFMLGWLARERASTHNVCLHVDALTKAEAMAIVKIIDDGGTTPIDHAWEENVLILDGERDPQDKLFETTWTSGARCSSDTYRLNANAARAFAGKSARRKIKKIAESE